VVPVDRIAGIAEVNMPTASEALPVEARTAARRNIPALFQKIEPFFSQLDEFVR
jgi:hypothetical protein